MLAEAAVRLASDVNADAILALTETGKNCDPLVGGKLVGERGKKIKVVVATHNLETYERFAQSVHVNPIKLTARPRGRLGQARYAMACGVQEGALSPGQRLVCLAGDGFADSSDSLMVLNVTGDELAMKMLESNPVLAAAVELAFGLGKGGQDGKPVGTAFMVGESKKVLRLSHQLMINPFTSYTANIADRGCWDLLKKYAVFDGAFIVGEDGVILAAHRFLNAKVKVEIPKGLGTRHLAVAAMTAKTGVKGVTVSGEDGAVRIFEHGRLVAKINPNSRIIEYLRESP